MPLRLRACRIFAAPDRHPYQVPLGGRATDEGVGDPGDVILVELPTCVGAISAFRSLQADLVGVPQEADGIDLAALDATSERVRGEGRGASAWPTPTGGFFLWLTLASGLDADKMTPRAVEHGVIYVAGEAFYVNALREPQGAPSERTGSSESRGGEGQNTLRLSFSAPTPERIDAGVARLAATLRAESAALATGAAAGGPAAS